MGRNQMQEWKRKGIKIDEKLEEKICRIWKSRMFFF